MLLLAVVWPGICHARDIRILVLHSYHADYAWTQNQHTGFVTTLEQSSPQNNYSYFTEYLDTKRKNYNASYEAVFADYLREKFRDLRPDAIYVTDDHALTFMRHHRARLFPEAPVFFSGINDLWLKSQRDSHLFTGVYERKDVVGNVKLALKMDPVLQTLYFVGDGSASHGLIARHVKEEMALHYPGLGFEFVTDRTLNGLERKLAEKGAGTLVLTTLGGLRGGDGGPVPIPLAIHALDEAGKFKILSMGANYLTEEVLGGSVVEGYAQGKGAAQVFAARMLGVPAFGNTGDDVANRPRMVFQYPLLQRWNIPLSVLPEQSTILGAPARTMGPNPRWIVGGLLFLLLQSLLLIVLLPRLRSLSLVRQALKGSERRFDVVARVINDALIGINEKGLVVIFNPAAQRMFGYGEEDMLGQPLDVLMPERYRDLHRQSLQNFFSGTPSSDLLGQNIELPALHSSGEEFFVELSLSLWPQGNSSKIIAALRDVTARRRADQKLRRSQERYRALLQTQVQPVCRWLPDTTLTYVNQAYCQLFGKRVEELLGRRIVDIMPNDERSRLEEHLQSLLANPGTMYYETPVHSRDGSCRWYRWSNTAIVGELGGVDEIQAVALDITERKRVEEDLRQSEKQFKRLFCEYQTLLDGIPDPIALIAPDLTVLRTNLATAYLVGRPVQELPGLNCCTLWEDCSCRQEECPVATSFRTGGGRKVVARARDGRSWEVRTFPIKNRTGNTVQVIRYANDITRQIQLREESVRTGQLASLGELAAGVAHEINNPINGIINYAQLLADSLEMEQDDRDILCGIIDEGERIANIVRNLLAFARARKEHKGRVALPDMLTCSLALTESQLRKDGIRLQVEISDGLPEIIAHAQEIQQVILNLLSNSRYALNKKYPGPDAQKILTIEAQAVKHRGCPSLQLTVYDQGIGIPQGVLHKVLDPFYTTKPTGEGTGLGLSISHGIIKDHQGEIVIDSKEGQYTRVTLFLPAAAEDSHEQ